MVSIRQLQKQLRFAVADLNVVLLDRVPAEEVFFVWDDYNVAHVAGGCIASERFSSAARWESIAGIKALVLARACRCMRFSPLDLSAYIGAINQVLSSEGPSVIIRRAPYDPSLRSTFPTALQHGNGYTVCTYS